MPALSPSNRALGLAALALAAAACASAPGASADQFGTYELRAVDGGGLPVRIWEDGDSARGHGQYQRIHAGKLFLRPDGTYTHVNCVEYAIWHEPEGRMLHNDGSGEQEGPYELRGDRLRLGIHLLHGAGIGWLEGTLRGDTATVSLLAPPVVLRFVRTARWEPPPPEPAVPDTGMPPYFPPPEHCPRFLELRD